MRNTLLALALALSSGSDESKKKVGVCWTRNEVSVEESLPFKVKVEDFAEVYAALVTLQASIAMDDSVKTCLFTSVSAAAVRYATKTLARRSQRATPRESRFDVILESADTEALMREINAEKEARLRDSPSERAGSTLLSKASSRLARVANLARSPFDVTLFLDADTAVCPTPRLGDLLRALARDTDVRVVELHASKGKTGTLRDNIEAEKRVFDADDDVCRECREFWNATNEFRCATTCALRGEGLRNGRKEPDAPCASFRGAPPSLQCGVMLVRRSPGLETLVREWIEAYVELHLRSDTVNKGFGSDQTPLNHLVADYCRGEGDRWTVTHLSPGFNFRGFANSSEFLVAGRVVVLHRHGMPSLDHQHAEGLVGVVSDICAKLNPPEMLGLRVMRDFDLLSHQSKVPTLHVEPVVV